MAQKVCIIALVYVLTFRFFRKGNFVFLDHISTMSDLLKIKTITRYLESIAPPIYQADYDNSGMQVGDPSTLLQGVLLALDPTEAVLEEAVEHGCNLVITHHPLLFRPIKKITPDDAVTRAILYAIHHGLHLYAFHTNLDHMSTGMNQILAEKLSLEEVSILAPLADTYHLLTTYVPPDHLEEVKKGLFHAGAGEFSAYRDCSFTSRGEGTFMPTGTASPFIGEKGKEEIVEEACLRTSFPSHRKQAVIDTLLQVHPYEAPLYHIQPIATRQSHIGAGMVGNLSEPLSPQGFLEHVKERLSLQAIRYTESPRKTIQRVALCSGSGSSFLPQAIRAKADAFITSDTKYHQFFDAQGKLMFVDIGHYESEIGFKDLIYRLLSKKFDNIALRKCTTNTNPILYQ